MNREIVSSVLTSVTRLRISATATPTTSPIAIPPPASAKKSSTVCPAEKLSPTATATATL